MEDTKGYFIAIDGDDIGDLVAELAQANKIDEARQLSLNIKKANQEIIDQIVSRGGDVIFEGGDNIFGFFALPDQLQEGDDGFEAIADKMIEIYNKHTKHTATVGFGLEPVDAHKALVLGKNSGKNKVVFWQEEYEPYWEEVVAYLENIEKNKLSIDFEGSSKGEREGMDLISGMVKESVFQRFGAAGDPPPTGGETPPLTSQQIIQQIRFAKPSQLIYERVDNPAYVEKDQILSFAKATSTQVLYIVTGIYYVKHQQSTVLYLRSLQTTTYTKQMDIAELTDLVVSGFVHRVVGIKPVQQVVEKENPASKQLQQEEFIKGLEKITSINQLHAGAYVYYVSNGAPALYYLQAIDGGGESFIFVPGDNLMGTRVRRKKVEVQQMIASGNLYEKGSGTSAATPKPKDQQPDKGDASGAVKQPTYLKHTFKIGDYVKLFSPDKYTIPRLLPDGTVKDFQKDESINFGKIIQQDPGGRYLVKWNRPYYDDSKKRIDTSLLWDTQFFKFGSLQTDDMRRLGWLFTRNAHAQKFMDLIEDVDAEMNDLSEQDRERLWLELESSCEEIGKDVEDLAIEEIADIIIKLKHLPVGGK